MDGRRGTRTRRSAPTTLLSPLPLFDITHVALERALSGASVRQKALTENLANANVPGYQRKDVDFHGALQRAMGAGEAAVESTSFAAQVTNDGAVRPDGGTVDIDRETTALAENGMEYQALTSIIRTRSDILRTAMGQR
jgi:flagellar basal-body rod protein FlgB